MKPFSLITTFCTLITLTGCQTYQSSYRSRSQVAQVQPKYVADKSSAGDLKIEAIRKEFDGVYEQVNILTSKLNEVQQNQAGFDSSIKALQQKLTVSTQENQKLKTELTQLKQEVIAKDKQVRMLLDNVVDQVAKDTASALSSMESSRASDSQGSQNLEFYEYKVQPGATLGAISKAYKCSVSEIKIANNLKSDVIYVGQKLKIPKK